MKIIIYNDGILEQFINELLVTFDNFCQVTINHSSAVYTSTTNQLQWKLLVKLYFC